jgi:hypothetical protein
MRSGAILALVRRLAKRTSPRQVLRSACGCEGGARLGGL